MISQIMDAKSHHCGQMARLLREEHKSAITEAGLDIHRELRSMFDASSIRKAWFLDGRLMMIGGVEGPLMSPEGFIWIAVSEEAARLPVRTARVIRDHLEKMMLFKHRLLALILADDTVSVSFARRIGFQDKETDVENNRLLLAYSRFQEPA